MPLTATKFGTCPSTEEGSQISTVERTDTPESAAIIPTAFIHVYTCILQPTCTPAATTSNITYYCIGLSDTNNVERFFLGGGAKHSVESPDHGLQARSQTSEQGGGLQTVGGSVAKPRPPTGIRGHAPPENFEK